MASAKPFDPFEALGVPRDASTATIKSHFRELARRYHPNRQQGSDEAKEALCEQFCLIHQAYKHVIEPNKRQRCLELLRLADEQHELLERMADLLAEPNEPSKDQLHQDGYLSSDADEDLPNVGLTRRQTVLRRTGTLKRLNNDGSTLSPPNRRRRNPYAAVAAAAAAANGRDRPEESKDYFAARRKKLEKLRRQELAAFEQYKNAMVDKFQAEMEVERTQEMYDQAKWRREYFERAPRETTERLRSFQQFMSAFRAFGQQKKRRLSWATTGYGGQILSTEDLVETNLLDPESTRTQVARGGSHTRAWSSDIAGDQTSSDEHSSDGRATPRPSNTFTWGRRHSRNTSLDAFELPSLVATRNDHGQASISEHGPFKMVIRQPTGFEQQTPVQQDADSSPESSARARSPSASGDSEPSQYTLVPNRRLSQLFRSGRERGLSPGSLARGGVSQANGSARNASPPPGQESFTVKRLGISQYSRVPVDNVHLLNYAEKVGMLHVQPDVVVDPAELLARVSRLDQSVASKFMVKPDIKAAFAFRLIYDHADKTDRHDSFIALSYRRKHHVERRPGHYTLPLDPEMFQAVFNERCAPNEGVWIDQICIDQESRTETTVSMSAMDMVYRSARLVIVVLDDIELNPHESDTLENHMEEYAHMQHVPPGKRFRGKQPPYLDTHEGLYNLLRKVFRSSWFKRAWCRHEMRLARDHVFLIPSNGPGSWSGKKVIRFTSGCLTHLLGLAIEVPFEADIELVKPALHAFFRDRSKLSPHARELHSHHGNFTTVVAEVFAMETGGDPRIPARQRHADALKDKVSIVLNTMECGLALTEAMRDPHMMLNKSESYYMLLTVALAAQDPGALCAVGPPMHFSPNPGDSPLTPTAATTWLFEPTNVDAGLNTYRTLNRLPGAAQIDTGLELGEHFVRLDMKFLTTREGVHRAGDDPALLELARQFVEACHTKKSGRNRSRYLFDDLASNRHFGSMRDVYVQTLACVFACGPNWFEEVCHRYGVSRWKRDGEAAWNLLVALKNTDGRWPVDAWSSQAAGFIIDFVHFLVIRGMPQRQILHREEWRPVWVSTGADGRVITFVPPGQIRPAIPTALLDCDYVQLARLWLLEPRESFTSSNGKVADSWTLFGKSVIFSDELATEVLHGPSGSLRDGQRVFGRESPEIQRLLRERSLYR